MQAFVSPRELIVQHRRLCWRTLVQTLVQTLVKKSRKKGRSAVLPLRPVMEG
jgi:hypothetical protein